jgi:NAD-dependent SIR2 family protein deacetylase
MASKVYLEHRDAYHVPGAASPEEIDVAVTQVAEALLNCDAWIITAGAGMGVDSGLPDFRGTNGLWKNKDLSMTYEEMSDDKWFREDPVFACGVNYTQLEMYRETPPHKGFNILKQWVDVLDKPYYVFTSNIDCQFEKAGFAHDKVVTCHGDVHHLQCCLRSCRAENCKDDVWSADCILSGLKKEVDPGSLKFNDSKRLDDSCFRCPRCSGLARPNIWFCADRNHVPWEDEIERRDNFNTFMYKISEEGKRLVVIECGGGMAIPTVRCEGEDKVDEAGEGSLLVRINPSDCKVPQERGVGLPFGAQKGLELINTAVEKLIKERQSKSKVANAKTKAKAKAKAGK